MKEKDEEQHKRDQLQEQIPELLSKNLGTVGKQGKTQH
jgi:hypothetical protein